MSANFISSCFEAVEGGRTYLCDRPRILDQSPLGQSQTFSHIPRSSRSTRCNLHISLRFGCTNRWRGRTPAGNIAAPAVAATAPTAIDSSAIVAADFKIEYRDFLVPSSTIASRENHTFPGYFISDHLPPSASRRTLSLIV